MISVCSWIGSCLAGLLMTWIWAARPLRPEPGVPPGAVRCQSPSSLLSSLAGRSWARFSVLIMVRSRELWLLRSALPVS